MEDKEYYSFSMSVEEFTLFNLFWVQAHKTVQVESKV